MDRKKFRSTDEMVHMEDTLPLEAIGMLSGNEPDTTASNTEECDNSVTPQMLHPQVALTMTPGQRLRAAKRTRRTTVALSMRDSDTKYNRYREPNK